MAELSPPPDRGLPLSPRSRRIGFLVANLMRLFAFTFRWRLVDPENLAGNPPDGPMIWIFWHNRIFAVPAMYKRYLPQRSGAILSSASRDGEIIAAVIQRFGIWSVRGSSSRRGLTAMRGLIDWLEAGYDVAVVPDGPRGPRYRLGPGAVKLAQLTGAKIAPMRVEYGSWWTFRSWDQFRLPKPFTTATVHFEPLIEIPSELDEDQFEQERLRVEKALNPHDETD